PEVVALDRRSSIRAQDRARSGQLRLRSEEGPTVLDRLPVMDSRSFASLRMPARRYFGGFDSGAARGARIVDDLGIGTCHRSLVLPVWQHGHSVLKYLASVRRRTRIGHRHLVAIRVDRRSSENRSAALDVTARELPRRV